MRLLRRQRLIGISTILAGAVALSAPAAATSHDEWLDVSPTSVPAGGSVDVSGQCPGGAGGQEEVTVFAGDGFVEPGQLGTLPIAADGTFSGPVTIPVNAPPATGEINVPCPDRTTILTAELTVTAGHPFATEIDWLLDQGIATGYDDGTFRGANPVTRQAMAAFVYRLVHDGADAPLCDAEPFPDVGVNNQFCGAISWLADNDLSTGYDDGTYRPTAPMSRQAMAAFFQRLFGVGEPAACEVAPFIDVRVDHPFCEEIFWMLNAEISDGYEDLTYRPAQPVSRQAMAAFMYRAVVEQGLTVDLPA